jgi:hypothetical protein
LFARRRQQQITELQRQLEAANAAVEKLSQARLVRDAQSIAAQTKMANDFK